MKFSIALGLLLAGLVHSQQLQPVQVKVDSFLRQTQHLKPSAKLVAAKQNGSVSTVTYLDGPMSTKFQVKTENNDMRIVGIEQVISFSSNLQVQPISIQDVPQNTNHIPLPPLPLIMPQFTLQPNGQLSSRNVFDQVDQQMEEMQRGMQQDRQNFQHMMEQKRLEMQHRLRKDFEQTQNETPLIGGGYHDFNEATNIRFDQPLIGGNHDYNWGTEVKVEDDHPLVGGDRDFTWMNIEIQPTQPLLGADDHDFIPQGPLIGEGDHDNWVEKKGKNFKHFKGQDHIARGEHKKWGHHKDRQQRHHAGMTWMNRSFTKQEVAPFLNEKLPDMMKGAQIISIQSKGFSKDQGIPLDIQIKNAQNNFQNISVYFRPRKQELLIDKISNVEKVDSSLETGKQLIQRFIKNLEENIIPVELAQEQRIQKPKEIETEDLVSPDFISEDKKPSLLDVQVEPDHKSEFLKIAKEIQFLQNNHIPHQKSEPEVSQVPLLGGQTDPDHKIEQTPLLGGQSDPDHSSKIVQKSEEKSEKIFDVTGLPLPGGEIDVDHKIGFDLVKKLVDTIVSDISEEDLEDINEVQEPKSDTKSEKPQLLIK